MAFIELLHNEMIEPAEHIGIKEGRAITVTLKIEMRSGMPWVLAMTVVTTDATRDDMPVLSASSLALLHSKAKTSIFKEARAELIIETFFAAVLFTYRRYLFIIRPVE